MEGAMKKVKDIFSAKVILVNHEKRLDIDTVSSNLAIKHNMLYISVYQLIKEHIWKNTEMGKALTQSFKPKALIDSIMN